MRPMLRPGLRVLRRDGHSIQIGQPTEHAAIIEDCAELRAVLAALDGVRRFPDVITVAASAGIPVEAAAATLEALIDLGLIADADELLTAAQMVPDSLRPHLTGDIAALALVSGARQSPVNLLRRRRQATVEVRGLGPVGAVAAWQLAVGGLGHLTLHDPAHVPPLPMVTGSTESTSERRRDAWLRTELRVAAPWARVRAGAMSRSAELVVLAADSSAGRTEVDRGSTDDLLRSDTPHLMVSMDAARAQLGPLVIPGRTPCLRCLDLHRTDRDPAWPALLRQLTSRTGQAGVLMQASDRSLGTLAGTWAAREAIAYVQGQWPITAHAVLEIWADGRPPSVHETHWHPACGCDWQQTGTMGA